MSLGFRTNALAAVVSAFATGFVCAFFDGGLFALCAANGGLLLTVWCAYDAYREFRNAEWDRLDLLEYIREGGWIRTKKMLPRDGQECYIWHGGEPVRAIFLMQSMVHRTYVFHLLYRAMGPHFVQGHDEMFWHELLRGPRE